MVEEVHLLDVVVGWSEFSEDVEIAAQRIEAGEVMQIRSKRETLNPNDEPMSLELCEEICGDFLGANADADVETVFSALDVRHEGRLALKFFILAYRILCKGSIEDRIMLLYHMVKTADEVRLAIENSGSKTCATNISFASMHRTICWMRMHL